MVFSKKNPLLFLLTCLLLLIFLSSDPLWASSWPDHPEVDPIKHTIKRGPSGYLSFVKITLCLILFLAWVKTTDWVSRDALQFDLAPAVWVPLNSFIFVGTFFFLFLMIPMFLIGYPLLLLSYVTPLLIYIKKRNELADLDDQVLSKEHLAGLFKKQEKGEEEPGVPVHQRKKKKRKLEPHEEGAPIEILPYDIADSQTSNSILYQIRQSPAYFNCKEVLYDAFRKHASHVNMIYAGGRIQVKYLIDGVWNPGGIITATEGEDLYQQFILMKQVANLSPDSKSPQSGQFSFRSTENEENETIVCTLRYQSAQNGEQLLIDWVAEPFTPQSLEELGVRKKVAEKLTELMSQSQGMLLISSLPQQGLSTTLRAMLQSTDRFMREVVAIEVEHSTEQQVDNVKLETYDNTAGETPDQILPRILRTEPDVLVVRELTNAETVNLLANQARSENLVFSTITATDSAEALLRVLMLKASAKEFAEAISAVINIRLIRKLCDHCKVAIKPSPELLQKLRLPVERVQQLFEPAPPPGTVSPQIKTQNSDGEDEPPPICPNCEGIGYRGRTAIVEFLPISNKIREVLIKQPKLDLLRKVAKAEGNTTLLEEGIMLVAKGITSTAELQRVMAPPKK